MFYSITKTQPSVIHPEIRESIMFEHTFNKRKIGKKYLDEIPKLFDNLTLYHLTEFETEGM